MFIRKLLVASVNAFGGQPGSGASPYFTSITHGFCRAMFLMMLLWMCLHLPTAVSLPSVRTVTCWRNL